MTLHHAKPAIAALAAIACLVLVPMALKGHGAPAARQGAEAGAPEIFCAAKSAGQLCTHGSADVLKLTGGQRQQWSEAVGRYNKAVEAATRQLLEEARRILSPEDAARVEQWFDKSVNARLNRLLLSANP